MNLQPQRHTLRHQAPPWVKDGSLYFITICARPRGQNQLCVAQTGQKLIDSALHYHIRAKWWLKLFLLMPDHLHALLAVPSEESLATVIRVWKGYQSKNVGIAWQSGFFDHRLRSDESVDFKADYIRMNPVKAKLVAEAKDWPFVWPKVGDRA